MQHSRSHPEKVSRAAWTALAAVFLVVYAGAMFSPGLLDDADATHAEAARAMAHSGDFVTLKVNGIRYLEKAPLMYWGAAIAYKIFGENEFSTRLPLALAVLLSMVLAVKWAERAFGARAGIYAGLALMTSTGFFLFTRIFIPEVILGLFIAAALYFFLTALEDRIAWKWYAAYASLALAVLTKGLVALVFAGGAAFVYVVLSGEWRRWREFRLFTGSLLLFAIAAPWHVLAGLRNSGGADGRGFFWFYFVNEHFLRFLGKRLPKDYNKMPALVYWLSHLVWLFPWSLFLPATVRDAWREWKSRASSAADLAGRTRLLCWIYALTILLFFSLSTNQEYYTFPVYFPLAMLIGAAVARAEEDAENRWLLPAHAIYAVLGIGIALALISGLWGSRHLPFVPDIGTALARRGVGNYTLSMSHFFDLTGESFAALRLPAMLAAGAMLIGPIAAFVLRRGKRDLAATWTVALTAAIFLVAAHIALVRFEPYLSSKRIALQLNQTMRPNDKLMIYGDQSYGSSLLFYTKRPICLVNGRSTSMLFGSTFPDAPRRFWTDEDLRREWESETRVFVFVPQERKPQMEAAVGERRFVVLEAGEKTVYSNRP